MSKKLKFSYAFIGLVLVTMVTTGLVIVFGEPMKGLVLALNDNTIIKTSSDWIKAIALITVASFYWSGIWVLFKTFEKICIDCMLESKNKDEEK